MFLLRFHPHERQENSLPYQTRKYSFNILCWAFAVGFFWFSEEECHHSIHRFLVSKQDYTKLRPDSYANVLFDMLCILIDVFGAGSILNPDLIEPWSQKGSEFGLNFQLKFWDNILHNSEWNDYFFLTRLVWFGFFV